MELILKQDVQNLGFKDDVVSVKPGYGRNFLIPQGFASLATPSAKKVLAENLKQRAHKEAKVVADAKASAMSILVTEPNNFSPPAFAAILISIAFKVSAKALASATTFASL